MARKKEPVTTKESAVGKPSDKRMGSAERSSYFARREAAKVLHSVLLGDARRRAVGSIKSLVYSPSVRNKRGTFALVCQTLKYLPVIKDILEAANILNSKWKRQKELMYVITYDIFFGQEASSTGDAEKFLLVRKDTLQAAVSQVLARNGLKHIKDLRALYQTPDVSKPRYVRVNTLKMDVESALLEMKKQHKVYKDDIIPELLVLPPGTDLHDHPLVMNGSVIMQGKASSMVAVALDPEPGWEVIDACSAPGNKTIHLAALMRRKGKIIACEVNQKRVKRLEDTIKLAGATNVDVLHRDFLEVDPNDPSYSKVRAIVVDPSCSGSGTAVDRLDHLLPSHTAEDHVATTDINRLTKLATFQKKILEHAFFFPAVERVVYSTCSVHQIEDEDVVKSVLPLAKTYGFQLATPFPQWSRRGLPVIEGSQHLLRTDLIEDKEGFFIALFVKKNIHHHHHKQPARDRRSTLGIHSSPRFTGSKKHRPCFFTKMSRMLVYHLGKQTRTAYKI